MIVQCNAAEYNDETTLDTKLKIVTSKLSRQDVFSLIPRLLNQSTPTSSATKLKNTLTDKGIIAALSLMQKNIDALLFKGIDEKNLDSITDPAIYSAVLGDFDRLLRNNRPKATQQTNEDTIDVIRMMFDIIFEDDRLTNKTKTLLAKLQIPVLKAAFLDSHYFDDSSHPAEKLINKLTDTAVAISKNDNKNTDVFYKETSIIVSQIINEFSDDSAIFSNILQTSRLFNKEIKKKEVTKKATKEKSATANASSSLQSLQSTTRRLQLLSKKLQQPNPNKTKPEQITTKKIPEKSKLLISNAIRNKIQKIELPKEIREFLTATWASVAATIYDTHGDKSETWKTTMLVVDELTWVFQPKTSAQEKINLTTIIPHLITNIQDGLQSTKHESKNKSKIFSSLLSINAACLKEQRMARNI